MCVQSQIEVETEDYPLMLKVRILPSAFKYAEVPKLAKGSGSRLKLKLLHTKINCTSASFQSNAQVEWSHQKNRDLPVERGRTSRRLLQLSGAFV